MASYIFVLLAAACFHFSYASVTPLSDADKQAIVDAHNEWRKNSGATAMRRLKWNDELAQFAAATTGRCAFEHTTSDQRKNIAGFDYIGENIYVNTAKPTFKEAVDDWGSEIKDFNLDTNQCSAVCGHYTQITWAKTSDVGCAIAQCGNVAGFNNAGYLVFCNYGIGGNMQGEKPFEKGTPGSKCQEQFNVPAGSDGLCGEGGSSSDVQPTGAPEAENPSDTPEAWQPTDFPDAGNSFNTPDAENPSGTPEFGRPRPTRGPQGGKPTGGPNPGRPSQGPQGGRPTGGSQGGRPTGGPQGGRPTGGSQGGRPTGGPQGGRPTGGPQGGRPTRGPQAGGRPNQGGSGNNEGPAGECKDEIWYCHDWLQACGQEWTTRACRKSCNLC